MAAGSFRKHLNWIVTLVCTLWMVGALYVQFIAVNPDQYGFRNPVIEQEMQNCAGSFEQRYNCKEALIIAKGHASFLIWLGKMALVLGPPVVVWNLLRLAARPRRAEEAPDLFEPPPPSGIKRHKIR